MPSWYVAKKGRVYNAFQVPFSDYDAQPEGVPQTFVCASEQELAQQLGTTSFQIIEHKPGPRPVPKIVATPAQMAAVASTIAGVSKETIEGLTKQPDAAVQTPGAIMQGVAAMFSQLQKLPASVPQVVEASKLMDKALLEYRLVVIRELNRAGIAGDRVQAVRKFILKLWPEGSSELDKIEIEEVENG